MTTVRLRRRDAASGRGGMNGGFGSFNQASRICLAFALSWPLLFYLFHSPGDGGGGGDPSRSVRSRALHLRSDVGAGLREVKAEMRHLMSRYELAGYGPSHPRVGIVITASCGGGDEGEGGAKAEEEAKKSVLESAESVFRTTDRNRILVVTAVMDGCSAAAAAGLEEELVELDSGGRGAHLHGTTIHSHADADADDKKKKKGAAHGRKVHVISDPHRQGVAASRMEGAAFVRILAEKHEAAGLKDKDEDILLLLLRAGAMLEEGNGNGGGEASSGSWLDAVTAALILPPGAKAEADAMTKAHAEGASPEAPAASAPEVHAGDTVAHAAKLANAVSLLVDSRGTPVDPSRIVRTNPGSTTSVDRGLARLTPSHAGAEDMALSNGESYPTPVTDGWAVAMRLATYVDLPASDVDVVSAAGADLQLSLNLWLCGDGADVLPGARASAPASALSSDAARRVSEEDAARIAAAWMDDGERYRAFQANDASVKKLNKMAEEAAMGATFPANLGKKCRAFEYFAELVGWTPARHRSNEGDENGGMQETTKDKEEEEDHDILHPHMKDHVDPMHRKPSKPLSDTNLAIVRRASKVSTAYVPMPHGPNEEHPHKGAKDENGQWGYVHDAAALRRDPPRFELSPTEKVQKCRKGDANWRMLTEKVFVDAAAHEAAERAHHRRVKIMCVVYTIEKYHDKIPKIRETWGQKCDGFLVASTKTDRSLGTVEIPHEGPEEYKNIWQKIRSVWSYVYDNYYDDYDYFHIGGDDLYVLVENLRLYLESEEIQTAQNGGTFLPSGGPAAGDGGMSTPLFLGRRFAEGGNMERIFNSGGSGYTLNRAALKTLVADSMPHCMPHLHTFSEDVLVAQCLKKFEVVPYDTKDENGGERYMPFKPGHHLTYRPPDDPSKDWYSKYSIDVKWGIDHCAARSVAFHYVDPQFMKRMHAILYGHC